MYKKNSKDSQFFRWRPNSLSMYDRIVFSETKLNLMWSFFVHPKLTAVDILELELLASLPAFLKLLSQSQLSQPTSFKRSNTRSDDQLKEKTE